jgi:hypothetical protein
MKLLTIADGFGDTVHSPSWYPDFYKWPKIIWFMTKGVNITDLSRYGAGNEYILQCLRHNWPNQQRVLIQWAIPARLDLMLNDFDDFWHKEIAADPVYANNTVTLGPQRWWLSSGSTNRHVKEYHTRYVSLQQHQFRSQMFVEHATLLLKHNLIDYKFFLTWDSDYLAPVVSDVGNWCWHQEFKGMHSFRKVSKFADLDFGFTQPISPIQFDFIKTYIMPAFDLPWRSATELDAVENMLLRKYKHAKTLRPT